MVKIYNKKLDKNIPKTAVYVGRPSKYGNPFTIGKNGSREEVIHKFREYAIQRLKTEPDWLDGLKGKDLVCWCLPLSCHAEVLKELVNGL